MSLLDAGDPTRHILHMDADLLIFNKPNRMPIYRGPGGGETLADHLPQLCFERGKPPAAVHRLDSATSGCLVLGRHKGMRRSLSNLFAQGGVEKLYWAVVQGRPLMDQGLIELPLQDVGWPGRPRVKVRMGGKWGRTLFQVMGYGQNETLLALMPQTGRTHQLRVHCAAMGCPIVGDPLYGGAACDGPPMHLHARRILLHGAIQQSFTAPAPPHLQRFLEQMRPF
ncbi:ribosomal large subunit pseudouridine synthase A [Magnetococcus marinus MC-1]|uniref:Ribosomal large subunit pseudouridine synthase A n=1 Tax=Magnetococcus marinus (strain ATCC BAA-1437 / JCM 17883 / MC-1) TaxID=156889 RepID=A0LBW6_MAGMM|nr:RNA pseudouridine synthase [Magnetococcus marinus]ABK45459.1 ribosomal large subunit pseudouridine synthase A [Magnetococcus marinus MC-1]